MAKKLEDGETCPFDDVRPVHANLAATLGWRLQAEHSGRAGDGDPNEPDPDADDLADLAIADPCQEPFWEIAQQLLRLQLPAEAFSEWIASATALRADPDRVVIHCRSAAHAEVLRIRLHTRIQAALNDVLRARTAVTYLVPAAEAV